MPSIRKRKIQHNCRVVFSLFWREIFDYLIDRNEQKRVNRLFVEWQQRNLLHSLQKPLAGRDTMATCAKPYECQDLLNWHAVFPFICTASDIEYFVSNWDTKAKLLLYLSRCHPATDYREALDLPLYQSLLAQAARYPRDRRHSMAALAAIVNQTLARHTRLLSLLSTDTAHSALAERIALFTTLFSAFAIELDPVMDRDANQMLGWKHPFLNRGKIIRMSVLTEKVLFGWQGKSAPLRVELDQIAAYFKLSLAIRGLLDDPEFFEGRDIALESLARQVDAEVFVSHRTWRDAVFAVVDSPAFPQ
ncbi:hypothetical protein HDU91_004444, partial [Kappamyces sp. JEL0680]